MTPPLFTPFSLSDPGGLSVRRRHPFVGEDGTAVDLPTHEHLGTRLDLGRLHGWQAVIMLAFAAIAAQLIWLQLVRGPHYRGIAEGNRIRMINLAAARGKIYDRTGVLLADNLPDFRLVITPADLPRDPGIAAALSAELGELMGQPADAVAITLAGYDRRSYLPQLLQDQLTVEQAVRLRVAEAHLPGVSLQVGAQRIYRLADTLSLSHVLGYLSRVRDEDLKQADIYDPTDRVGRSGFEQAYEALLRGTKGHQQVEINAQGAQQEVLAHEEPQAGADLAMTLDAGLQAQVETLLEQTLRAERLSRATVVVLDPRTSDVLALISLPAYDANQFAFGLKAEDYAALLQDPDRPLFNRSVAGVYPSGSTIKPVLAAAALHDGIVTPNTVISSTGGIRVGQWYFPDWKAGGHGATNLTKAIAESVNTYFYTVGGGYQQFKGIGHERMAHYFRLAGLGQPSGIDLPGEVSGHVPTAEWKLEVRDEPWYIGDTYHLAIGQGDLLVTPLQVANFTAMIANGGTLFEPRLALGKVGPEGLSERFTPQAIRRDVFTAEELQVIRTAMRATVTVGSARGLADAYVPMAGKTGTAEWSDKKPTHAWFTGFAPVDNPKIVVTVLIEEGGEGSRVAAPLAERIVNWWAVERAGVTPVAPKPAATSTPTTVQTR